MPLLHLKDRNLDCNDLPSSPPPSSGDLYSFSVIFIIPSFWFPYSILLLFFLLQQNDASYTLLTHTMTIMTPAPIDVRLPFHLCWKKIIIFSGNFFIFLFSVLFLVIMAFDFDA